MKCPICGGSTAYTLPVGLFTREGVPTLAAQTPAERAALRLFVRLPEASP